MILTDLQLEGVRRFSAPVRLCGLGPGLNVLAAPNEAGKSTLLQALRAAFMLRCSSKSQPVKDLESYGGSAPHIVLHFTWNGTACALEKRFKTKTCTRLSIGPNRYEGDEAEEQLRALLGLTEASKTDAGLWNALLVGQGESFTLPTLNETGQASIRSCLAQGLEVATGGVAASVVLAKVKERLGQLQTAANNRPTGRYKQALEQEAQAQEKLATLQARKTRLEEDINALDLARRALRQHTNPEQRVKDEAALQALRTERDKVQQLEGEEKLARTTVALAKAKQESCEQEQNRRLENRAHQNHLSQQYATLQQTLEALLPRVQQAGQQYEAACATRARYEQAHEQARRHRSLAAQHAALAQKQQHLTQEQALLKRAETAQLQLEQAEAALNTHSVTEAVMERLRSAERLSEQLQAQCEAQAPKLSFALLPEAAAKVRVAGAPCPPDALSILTETRVDIEGVGAFTISPAHHDRAGVFEKWQSAQQALTQLLQQVGCNTTAEAATQHEQYRQAKNRVLEAKAAFMATLPEGTLLQSAPQSVANMRKHVAQIQAVVAQAMQTLPPVEQAQESTTVPPLTPEAAAEAEEQAAQKAEEARQAERTAQAAQATMQTHYQNAQNNLREVKQALAQAVREEEAFLAHCSDEALQADLAQAQQAFTAAYTHEAQLAQKRADVTPLDVLEGRIQRHEQRQDNARATITQLTGDIGASEARIRMAEGEGIDEQIAEAERVAERLQHDREGYERERAALALLQQTLSKAEQEQTERYLAPLVRTMQPAFNSVFPGAAVALNTQFEVQKLTRRQEEEFKHLSDGTREQIAVLVRLGFAELLHNQHGTSLLVLDDALSFSDSQRLERLFDVLQDASTRFQIVVLTCHAENFAALGGRALSLTPIESLTELR